LQKQFRTTSRSKLAGYSIGADVRYALRGLSKSPSFTVVAALTLVMGIGANVVVFAVLNAILLRPLGVSDPDSLYQMRHKPWMKGRLVTTSYPAFEDFRQRNSTFSGMAAVNAYSSGRLNWGAAKVSAHGDEVSGNYFDLLGVLPEVGRVFHAADEHGQGSAPYMVLSDNFWRSAFQADPGVVGTKVLLNKDPFIVIGVAAAQFHATERFAWPDYWTPIVNGGADFLQSRNAIAVTVLGRLKPGTTVEQATENLNAISAELAREYPKTDDGLALRLIHPGLFGDDGEVIRGFLYGVTVLAVLVLAAACANLASLFAARAADRSKELALRVALGASGGRLVRQLLTEAVMVSTIGGAVGLAGAQILLGVLNRWPRSAEAHLSASLDARVYLEGLLLTFGCALLFGMVPARRVWRSSPLQMMKRGPGDAHHPGRLAMRDLLLGAQIAICTLLVTASFVAVRGLERALQAPLGIQPQGVIRVDLDLSQTEHADDVAVEKALVEAARNISGVTAVGMVNRTPMTGGIRGVPVYRLGTTEFTLKNYALTPYVFSMSPGYLAAAGTRLLGGRDVSWQDTTKTPYVAIANESFARKMLGQTTAIGQRFILYGHLTEIVGVVEDGKYHDLTEGPQAALYVPLSQIDQGERVLAVRSRRGISEMTPVLERTLSAIEPDMPMTMQSWADSLEDELLPARAATVALGVMGLLAAMLAVTGIFGMAAYSVSKRIRELGIRVALGAGKTQVISAAVGRSIVLLGMGSAVGLLAGISANRLLGQIVYQANPKDPVVLGGAVVTMALLGVAASALPAMRAVGVDPAKLMREE
jgi:predicted permease